MEFCSLIRKKRDGLALTKEELTFFANAAAKQSVPDYQLSAMLMAMYLRGLDARETADLTLAMAHSGDTADLSSIPGIKADKHSTGGVGDKTTLIVAPVAAACGLKIAKMSGRGLGHTGGTVDKLESIPGFQTALSAARFTQIVNETGLCVVGQSGDLCPADKTLYALRDVTETVSSIPLIASSIMSKKLAGGADCIVLDVKCGSGAFMQTLPEAKALARAMVDIGKRAGRKTAALITNMDAPLGKAVGNSNELIEAISVLRGEGPDDLREVALSLAAKLLETAGTGTAAQCRELAKGAIESGAALEKLCAMVSAQGGDAGYIKEPARFPAAKHSAVLNARESGYLMHMDAAAVGQVCVRLGAGRQKKGDPIDHTAGIYFYKKPGDPIRCGEAIAKLFCEQGERLEEAAAALDAAITFGKESPQKQPMVFDCVE